MENTKVVSQLDDSGIFIGATVADESPLDPGVFLIPAGAVDYPPPPIQDGHYAQWTGANFEILPVPVPEPILSSVPDPLTAEQVASQYEAAAQALLDTFAKSWGYDSLVSAVSYVGDPFQRFNDEAIALRNWRSEFWQAANQVKTSVQGGAAMPATVADFLALLPAGPVRPT